MLYKITRCTVSANTRPYQLLVLVIGSSTNQILSFSVIVPAVSSHEDRMDMVGHRLRVEAQSRTFWQCYGRVWLNIPSGPKRRTGTWEGSESLTVDKNISDNL